MRLAPFAGIFACILLINAAATPANAATPLRLPFDGCAKVSSASSDWHVQPWDTQLDFRPWRASDGDVCAGGAAAWDGIVRAVAGGQVVFRGWHTNSDGTPGFGNLVIIRHPLAGSANEYEYSYYAHLSRFAAGCPDEGRVIVTCVDVAAGDEIGMYGHTGAGSGDHLHFQLGSSAGFARDLNARERLHIRPDFEQTFVVGTGFAGAVPSGSGVTLMSAPTDGDGASIGSRLKSFFAGAGAKATSVTMWIGNEAKTHVIDGPDFVNKDFPLLKKGQGILVNFFSPAAQAAGTPTPLPMPAATGTPQPATAPRLEGVALSSEYPGTIEMTIFGSGFECAVVQDRVYRDGSSFGSGLAERHAQSCSSTQVVIEQHMSGAPAGAYTVTLRNGASAESNHIMFTLIAPPRAAVTPRIDSLATSGSAPSTFIMTIRGGGFDCESLLDRVYRGSEYYGSGLAERAARSCSETEVEIVQEMGGSAAGTYGITLRNGTGPESNRMLFTLTAPATSPVPTAPGIAPPAGTSVPIVTKVSLSRATPSTFDMTIDGSGFICSTLRDTVYLGPNRYGSGLDERRAESCSSTKVVIEQRMTGSEPGVYGVTLRNGEGPESNRVSFTLQAPTPTRPTIDSVSLSSNVPSTLEMTIRGSGFDCSSLRDTVYRDGREYGSGLGSRRAESCSSGRVVIVQTMSGSARGTYSVTLKNGTGPESNAKTFTLR